MIYISNSQLNTTLIFISFGILFEIIKIFFTIIFKINSRKKLIKTLFFSVFYVFFSVFFVFLINFFNFGFYSITLFLATIVGSILIKSTYIKSFVLLKSLWYNLIKKPKNTKDKNSQNAEPNQN